MPEQERVMPRPPLNEQLRAARQQAGLNVSETARRAHASRATIYAYESGDVSPSLETAQRVLAVSGYELLVVPSATTKQTAKDRN